MNEPKKLDPTAVERYRGRVKTVRGADKDGIDLGVEMRDEDQHERNEDQHSSDDFLGANFDPKNAEKKFKRKARFNQALADLMGDTARSAGLSVTNATMHTISDETWMNLRAHPEAWQEEGFEPLSAYAHKLVTPSGRVLRSLYPGEVGTLTKEDMVYYLCLEEGKTPGVRVGVDVVDNSKKEPKIDV